METDGFVEQVLRTPHKKQVLLPRPQRRYRLGAYPRATTSSFADDTNVLMKITEDLACERLQDDLSTIYD
jgi:hypothetical protein